MISHPERPTEVRRARITGAGGIASPQWFRHAIYAPGEYTGYAAVVIPGINEALDKGDKERAQQQLAVLAAALERAAKTLDGYR